MNIIESNDQTFDDQTDINRLIDTNRSEDRESVATHVDKVIAGRRQHTFLTAIDNYLLCLTRSNEHNISVIMPRLLSIASFLIDCDPNRDSNLDSNCDTNLSESMRNALTLLESNEFECAVKQLIKSRQLSIDNKPLVSYFYELCVTLLIKNCVKTSLNNAITGDVASDWLSERTDSGQWVTVSSAARIDLQGGWTDTPPICYEIGGKVVNIAIAVNGKHPIGAKARKVRLSGEHIIRIKEFGFDSNVLVDITLRSLQDLSDYHLPNSCGSLIKAALICAQIVDIKKSDQSLHEQLELSVKSGLEIEIWSALPQGSGLGTSSILAGCLLAALWTLTKRSFTRLALMHAVLYLEQLLTTGGGWQDQIGGLIGGTKLGFCDNRLPLSIDYKSVAMSSRFRSQLNNHLMLIYTGSVRLAKRLLQNVIRNWYIRDKQIIDCFNELTVNAELCYQAFIDEDLTKIGALYTRYWEQKKILAPGCEPMAVALFLKAVKSYILGGCMCGAGGGGFLCVIVSDEAHKQLIAREAQQLLPDSQLFQCHIDDNGFQVTVNDDQYIIP